MVSGFTYRRQVDVLARVQTSVRVVYDQDNIYFAIRCYETAQPRKDIISVLIDPEQKHSVFYGFWTSMLGKMYVSPREELSKCKVESYSNQQPRWGNHARAGISLDGRDDPRGGEGWLLEMAIPWGDVTVERPVKGMVIGLNVQRARYHDRKTKSFWAPQSSAIVCPSEFGHLVLSPTEEILDRMENEFRKGGRHGTIHVFNKVGYSNKTYVELAREAFIQFDRLIEELRSVSRAAKSDQARAEIQKQLRVTQKEMAAYRYMLSGELDGAEWARLNVRLQRHKSPLSALLWQNKLAALLEEI